MSYKDLVMRTRSFRRFQEDNLVSMSTLKDLVDTARNTASAGNLQPLRYIISSSAETNGLIFQNLVWAAYLKDWDGPAQGERPTGYIIILVPDKDTKMTNIDVGIACQTIMTAATDQGLGGCILASVKREALEPALQVPEGYIIKVVLALGVPAEKVVLEEMNAEGDVKYYRDAEDVHHVPKRSLAEVVVQAYEE